MANKTNAHEIVPGLWVGNSVAATDEKFIKNNNIKAVLNITSDIDNKFRHLKNIEYARISVEDSLKRKDYNIMTETLPFAVEFIHKNLDLEKKNVLVHCWQGMQRSCAAVTGYLIKYHTDKAPSISKAINLIVKKRPVAFHRASNVNFISSLKKYHHKIQQKSNNSNK